MTDRKQIDARTAERLLATWRALREGKLKVAPQLRELAEGTSDMVHEVSFGLASLVQRQQKAMSDIERK